MAYCAQCGITYPPDKRFCKECGSPLTEEPQAPQPPPSASQAYCASCGWPLPSGKNFCPQCGAKVIAPAATAQATPPPPEPPVVSPVTESYPEEESAPPSPPPAQPANLNRDETSREESVQPEQSEISFAQPEAMSEEPLGAESPTGESQGVGAGGEAPTGMPPAPRKSYLGVVIVVVVLIGLAIGGLVVWHKIKARRAAAQLAEQAREAAQASQQLQPSEVNTLDAKTKDTMGRMGAILFAIDAYKSAKKKLPLTWVDLGPNMRDPSMRNDEWGNPFIYLVDTSNNGFVLSSSGPDGKRDTPDDIQVTDTSEAQWRNQHQEVLDEWRVGNLDLYQKLSGEQISAEAQAALEKKRMEQERIKAEKAAQLAAQQAAQQQQQQELQKQQDEAARLADQLKQQQEAQRQAEAERQRQLAETQRKARLEKMNFVETFSPGLPRWAAASFRNVTEKGKPGMRIVGFGLLRDASDWDNYTVGFDVKIHKEAVNFIVRARDRQNFYFLKLTDDKARDFPKNSLIKYIYQGGRYVAGPGASVSPGAYAIVSLPFKVKQNAVVPVVISASGNTLRVMIDGRLVDTWQDNTFKQGSFGFNCGAKEEATVTNFQVKSVN